LNSTSNKKALRDQLTIDLEDKGLILGNTKASLELQIHSADEYVSNCSDIQNLPKHGKESESGSCCKCNRLEVLGKALTMSLLEDLRHKTLLAQKQASGRTKFEALLCHFQNLVFNDRSKKQQEKSLKGWECIA